MEALGYLFIPQPLAYKPDDLSFPAGKRGILVFTDGVYAVEDVFEGLFVHPDLALGDRTNGLFKVAGAGVGEEHPAYLLAQDRGHDVFHAAIGVEQKEMELPPGGLDTGETVIKGHEVREDYRYVLGLKLLDVTIRAVVDCRDN